MLRAIVGIAGLALSAEEAGLLRALPPAGVILFGRNVAAPGQVRALTGALRGVLDPAAVIAVDQEGGRVARLRPPHWRAHPAAGAIGALGDGALGEGAAERAAYLQGALIGAECLEAGIDLVCAPVLDRFVAGASGVIGDRAFGSDAARVGVLGAAMAEGLMAAGVLPVGKHAPGHGRAMVDSHEALPVVPAGVDLEADLAPFRACAWLPWMMTAHLLYSGLDPERPGTLSPAVIGSLIRGRIGFGGVLVSDDLAMGALTGSAAERAQAALAAGCDVALHCSGVIEESEAVLRAVPAFDAAGTARLAAGRAMVAARRRALDVGALADERAALLGC